jgi:uncharacterized protein YdaU (DUF1376 family)
MSAPFMQLYVADYLGDTRHLTTEQHGAYLLLLMTMWRADGRLPNDPKKLARVAGCTPSRWAKISAEVMAFFDEVAGEITNKRLVFELEKAREKSIKRVDAGTKGGNAKALKTQETPLAIASRLPEHSSEPEPEPEREDGGGGSACAWPAKPMEALVDAVASPWLDPMKAPGLITSSGKIAAWRQRGAEWGRDVLPVVRGLCAAARGPISTWGYFDRAVLQALSDNSRETPLPEARASPSVVSLTYRIASEHAEARRLAFARLEAQNG